MDKLLKNRKWLLIAVIMTVIAVPLAIWGINNLPSNLYNRTLAALEKGDTGAALAFSEKLSDNYKDAEQLKVYCEARWYEAPTPYPASLFGGGRGISGAVPQDAYYHYIEIPGYKDADERAVTTGYDYVVQVINNPNEMYGITSTYYFDAVSNILSQLGDYKDLAELKLEAGYKYASYAINSVSFHNREDVTKISNLLNELGDYKNSAELLGLLKETVYKRVDELCEQAQNENNIAAYEEAEGIIFNYTFTDNNAYNLREKILADIETAKENIAAAEISAEAEAERQRLIAESEQKARDSLDLAKRSIVGTWERGTLGEYKSVYVNDGYIVDKYADIGTKARFLEDGTFETYQGNLVQTGRYYFEDIYLVFRMPTLIGGAEEESKYTVYMISDTQMEITEAGEAAIDNGFLGTTQMTYHPTTYSKQ